MRAHVSHAFELDLHGTNKLILVYLAHNTGSDGQCTVSYDEIANACGVSLSTAKRGIKQLGTARIIKIHTGRERGRQAPNVYEIQGVKQGVIQGVKQGITTTPSNPLNNPLGEGGSSPLSKDKGSSPPEATREKDPIELFEQNFTSNGHISMFMLDKLRDTMHDVGADMLYDAMAETLSSGGRTFGYVEKVLESMKEGKNGRRGGLRGRVPKPGRKRTVGADFSKTRELANRKRRAKSVSPERNTG